LLVGSLAFEGMDQLDLTGPFEVLSRMPGAACRVYAKSAGIVRDVKGLGIIADAALAEAPQLDVLHVPGGFGQEALMDDAEVLDWVARQAAGARFVLSVCTGALICGAAGLLKGKRATTHWAVHHLLPLFGANAEPARVVVDGSLVSTAGVTAGIDGALTLAALACGEDSARSIQLAMQYAPDPPFDSGTLESAPPQIVEGARAAFADITRRREATARRIGLLGH